MPSNPFNPNRKVYVYRNLRRNCLSLQQSGLIVGYAEAVILQNVEFRVRESGRQRVLREGRKNVHAFAIGMVEQVYTIPYTWVLNADRIFDRDTSCQISYNPYRFPTFFDVETLEPMIAGKRVLVTTKAIYSED